MDWKERKIIRTIDFMERYKKKLVKCFACNGTGYYDHNGSPKCSACNGTGKVRALFPYMRG